jgi:hypothetical protein
MPNERPTETPEPIRSQPQNCATHTAQIGVEFNFFDMTQFGEIPTIGSVPKRIRSFDHTKNKDAKAHRHIHHSAKKIIK